MSQFQLNVFLLLLLLPMLVLALGASEHHNSSEQPAAASLNAINSSSSSSRTKFEQATDDDEQELHLLDSNSGHKQQQQQQQQQSFTDLFAYTFDDYLREATKQLKPTQAHQYQLLDAAASSPQSPASGHLFEGANKHSLGRLLVVEDEDELAPASQPTDGLGATNKHDNGNYKSALASETPLNDDDDDHVEVKLLFAWKALLTNKCSRACGRGFRLNHLSCHDLKFKVRVEDELCLKSSLTKPNELSDEPCNEIDCEPSWTPIELAVSGDSTINNSKHGTRFKRVGCAMLNKHGHLIHLDESRCQDNNNNNVDLSENSSSQQLENENENNNDNDKSKQIHRQREQNNDILSPDDNDDDELELTNSYNRNSNNNNNNHVEHNTKQHNQRQQLASITYNHQHLQQYRNQLLSNEPFFEPGNWSECQGARCAGLGRRYRNVTCRLYLAKSGKFVSLPSSSCQSIGSISPDLEEPCYMDCSLQATKSTLSSWSSNVENNNNNEYNNNNNNNNGEDNEDDEVYDPTVARYVWQHNSWTECSAKCLGGQMESLVDCFDKVTGLRVSPQHCEQQLGLDSKPAPIIESCNDIACAPEWRPGPFSNCSQTCGSSGLRTRSVACVQLVASDMDQVDHEQASAASDYMLVPDDHCHRRRPSLEMPHKQEPCNRVDCEPEWSLGPWSECRPNMNNIISEKPNEDQREQRQRSSRCPISDGLRNRTVVCLQEFAKLDSVTTIGDQQQQQQQQQHAKLMSKDMLEALRVGAQNHWHPGKPIQVPLEQCYQAHRFVPPVSESCKLQRADVVSCDQQHTDYATQDETPTPSLSSRDLSSSVYIDAEPKQDFKQLQGVGSRRRSVTLKVGGRAQLIEGRTVKIRCRIISSPDKLANYSNKNSTTIQSINLVKQKSKWPVEWRKDGLKIFANNSTIAERVADIDQYQLNSDNQEEDENSILSASEVLNNAQLGDTDRPQADEPPRLQMTTRRTTTTTTTTTKTPTNVKSGQKLRKSRGRSLNIRSNDEQTNADETNDLQLAQSASNLAYKFVPQVGGRFSLVKDSTLRIKRLKLDDSGVYTCHLAGLTLSESIEINVVGRRQQKQQQQQLVQQSWPSTF